ncbi:hypothetical protein PG985_005236 [Apiospora marii]|uniref:uncharacterized protein n=1 Tax=Apiospora marii TaxID=335849 RepID=UPI0031314E0E
MSSSNQDQQQQPVTIPDAPTSPQLEKDAARAMKGAESWKPSFARQQSFSKEEQKRELQMTGLGGGKSAPGFSEK